MIFSAGTGTCYLSGVKSNYEVIGVNAKISSDETNCSKIEQNHVTSIMEMARSVFLNHNALNLINDKNY